MMMIKVALAVFVFAACVAAQDCYDLCAQYGRNCTPIRYVRFIISSANDNFHIEAINRLYINMEIILKLLVKFMKEM